MKIVTNNPFFQQGQTVIWKDSAEAVLVAARDLIHKGHKLLNHPKYGNIQPYQWLYRTLLISDERTHLDVQSLDLIEDAIYRLTQAKYLSHRVPETQFEDYQLIDADLILKAVQLSCEDQYTRLLPDTGREVNE
jgi:hypothetical protein